MTTLYAPITTTAVDLTTVCVDMDGAVVPLEVGMTYLVQTTGSYHVYLSENATAPDFGTHWITLRDDYYITVGSEPIWARSSPGQFSAVSVNNVE